MFMETDHLHNKTIVWYANSKTFVKNGTLDKYKGISLYYRKSHVYVLDSELNVSEIHANKMTGVSVAKRLYYPKNIENILKEVPLSGLPQLKFEFHAESSEALIGTLVVPLYRKEEEAEAAFDPEDRIP